MHVNYNGDPYGIRTRVTAVKGRCLNRLTNGPVKSLLTMYLAESKGFEPLKPINGLHDFQSCSFSQLGQLSKLAPQVGFEPTTDRLTADCSTTELLWNEGFFHRLFERQ